MGTDASAELPLILFAHKGHDWIRGSEQCLLDLLAGLHRDRFRLLLVANGHALVSEARALGTDAVRIGHWGGGELLGAPWRFAMRRLLAARRPAVIHANMAVTLPLLAPAARALGIPVVTHLHLPFASLAGRHQTLVRESDAIVGVAAHVLGPLCDDDATRDRLRVIRNAVNVERLGGSAGHQPGSGHAREIAGVPRTGFIAVSVGSLIDRKSHDVTIRGVALARARGLDVHLLLCGDGEDDARLRALAQSMGLATVVHFLGARSDVGALLQGGADMLVTSAGLEAMPLSVMEAQWLGVPVIASDIPAHRELLGEDERGVLVPFGDAGRLADALDALARDAGRRERLAVAARTHARWHYLMSRYVHEFESLYDELAATGTR